MFNISLFNSLLYTLGWFWCVWCGANDQSVVGFLGGIFLIFIQLMNTAFASRLILRKDLFLLLLASVLGFLMELAFLQGGVIAYSHSNGNLPPLWIFILYPLFALLLNHSLRFLQKSYLVTFLFGVLGAPLSYIAGQHMGAATLNYSLLSAWIVIGISWGILLVVLIAFNRGIENFFEKD